MATIFNNISPNGENRRLMLIDAWAEDPLTVEMMDHPVNGDRVAVRSHNSLNEIVVDSVNVYDNGSWVEEGGGGGGATAKVTITNTSGGGWTFKGAIAITMYGISATMSSITPDGEAVLTTGGQWDVYLYEGNAFVELKPAYAEQNVALSGDVTVMGSGYMVTGDCTFTISL